MRDLCNLVVKNVQRIEFWQLKCSQKTLPTFSYWFLYLFRDENGNEIKHKKSKKRKREVNEHVTDGTECNGVDSSQVETNGVKKKKKKEKKDS